MNLPDPIPTGLPYGHRRSKQPPRAPRAPTAPIPTPEQLAAAAQQWPAPPEEAPTPLPPPPPIPVSSWEALELKRLLVEKAKRQAEALKLYVPLPRQFEFHASFVRQRLLRGSNRSGKTLGAAVEVARAVSGTDPYDKYPKYDGRAFCVGKNLDHVG